MGTHHTTYRSHASCTQPLLQVFHLRTHTSTNTNTHSILSFAPPSPSFKMADNDAQVRTDHFHRGGARESKNLSSTHPPPSRPECRRIKFESPTTTTTTTINAN